VVTTLCAGDKIYFDDSVTLTLLAVEGDLLQVKGRILQTRRCLIECYCRRTERAGVCLQLVGIELGRCIGRQWVAEWSPADTLGG
jgi:hypothetical protein